MTFSKIGLIGVPQDLGASRRGVDMGASSIRIAGLYSKLKSMGYQVIDFGNIRCHDAPEHVSDIDNSSLRYLDHIVETCKSLKLKVQDVLEAGCFPLIIGGDHSISIGTLAGMRQLHDGKTGILWVDAHGDFNTVETTPSGNIHGMPFAVILDRGNEQLRAIGPSPTALESNAVLYGVRDLDPLEIQNLKNSTVKIFSMRDIDEIGNAEAAKEAIRHAIADVDYLHVSFDIDSLDPVEAPGTGTPVTGGLTFREAHLLMELVHETGKLASFELVEVNPTLDVRNQTASLAVGLISSALGKKIV